MRKILLSLASSMLLILSFCSPALGFISFFALVPLLRAIASSSSWREAFGYSYVTGVMLNAFVFFWLTNGIWLVFIIASLLYGLYIAGFGVSLYFLKIRFPRRFIFSAPLLWVAFEWLKGYGFFAFPIGLIAHTLAGTQGLLQLARVTGILFISLLIVGINVLVYQIIESKTRIAKLIAMVTILLIFLFWTLTGKSLLAKHHGKAQKIMRVALIQGNILPKVKWNTAFLSQSIDIYEKLSIEALKSKPEMIVWPETAVACFLFHPERKEYLERLLSFSKEIHIPLLLGTLDLQFQNRKYAFNSAVLLENGRVVGKYDKIKLIPIMERAPFKRLIPFLRRHNLGSIYDPGTEYTIFQAAGRRFGVLICFEGIFAGHAKKFKDKGVDFFLNITNDNPALGKMNFYHRENIDILKIRAIENQVPVVRCSNDGISGVIDANGDIISEFPLYQRGFFLAEVPIYTNQ